MTKLQLIRGVAINAKVTYKIAEEVIEGALSEISRTLKKGEKVVLSGFGTFYVGRIKDKMVEPFGKKEDRQLVKSHRVVNFKVGKPLKREVW